MDAQLRRRIASALFIVGFFAALGSAVLAVPRQRHRAAQAEPDHRHPGRTHAGAVAARTADALHDADRIWPRHRHRHCARRAIGSSRLAYDVAYPLLIGFATIPKVAVVPIFVLWFGAGACRRCSPR